MTTFWLICALEETGRHLLHWHYIG